MTPQSFLINVKTNKDNYDVLSHDGFILSKINKTFSNLLGNDWLFDVVKLSTNEMVGEDNGIKDIIPVSKKAKTGIPGGKTCLMGGLGVYAISGECVAVTDFTSISKINSVLHSDSEFMPVFYIYLLKSKEDIDYNDVKIKLGQTIALKIIDRIIIKLETLC